MKKDVEKIEIDDFGLLDIQAVEEEPYVINTNEMKPRSEFIEYVKIKKGKIEPFELLELWDFWCQGYNVACSDLRNLEEKPEIIKDKNP
jgi:hypothetical protein